MSEELRITLADEASTQTTEPDGMKAEMPKVLQAWDGLSALIGLVADTQTRLDKIEAERSTPHAIDHAIEEAVSEIDWDGHAENALAECDTTGYARDAIDVAKMDIDLSGEAEEAVDAAVASLDLAGSAAFERVVREVTRGAVADELDKLAAWIRQDGRDDLTGN